jgi:hypothetical protein
MGAMYDNVVYITMWDNEWAWARGTGTHLINRFGLYQGTTLVVPAAAGKVRALALARTGPSGAEAQLVIDPLRHGRSRALIQNDL